MYSNDYDDEEEEQESGNFFVNFYNNNKVLVWIFLGIIIFIILISLLTRGGSDVEEEIEYGVNIYPPESEVYVSVGRSTNLSAIVKNNPNGVVTWKVEDESIASVDNGNVKGLDYGQTKVTATFVDENNKEYSDTRNIIVADGDSNVSLIDVSFKDGDLFMPLNATYKLAMVLTPANGFVQNEDFISSNLSVVTVDNSGLITAVGEGNAVISVDVNNGQFRKELNVYVDRNYTKNEIIITPETIFFDGELRKVKVGSVSKLSYTVRPNNADTSRLIWKSSDESVITVQNGVINAIREGRAVITVSALNGETDRVDIEVEKDIIEVKSISVDESVINLNVGRSKTITPVVNPDNASNKALSFTSLNDYVAFVDPNETGTKAKITGISEGNTSIVIEASNNVKKTIKVVVTDPNKQNAATPTPTPYDGGSNYWQPTATPYYWQPTATPYYWQPTATPYYWQPTATPRPTYTPTPRPTATPADPEIVCQTPVYNGSKQIVATCKNGKFTAPITTNSSIYEAVGKVDGQIFNLKCSNGIVTKSKDCSIKKRVIEPAGDCYDGLYLSPFSYCTVPSGKKCGLSGMAYLTTKVQTQSSTQRVSCTNIQQATPTPNIPTIKTSYAFKVTDEAMIGTPQASAYPITIRTTFGRTLGVRVVYDKSSSINRIAYAGSYNLTELRNLKLNNFVRWYVGRDSFGARVAPKIEKNSATNGKSCIWDINDAKPSGSDFNFEFDLDELDQIGNGYYSSNPTGVTPYYVLIRLVDSNGNMSNPTIFKITTNGSRDEKTWSVSKIS